MSAIAILNAVETALAQITVANGFNTNIGQNVLYWRNLPNEYGASGAVTFRDPETVSDLVNQAANNQMRVEIEAIATSDDAKNTGYNLTEDVCRIIRENETWDGHAIKTSFADDAIAKDVETQGKQAVRVQVAILITYRDKRFYV